MAEPQEKEPLYDDNSSGESAPKPSWYYNEHPSGEGDNSEPKRGHLQSVKDDGSSADSPETLKDKEANPESTESSTGQAEDQIGKGFNPNDTSRFSRAKQIVVGNKGRRRVVIGAGVGGTIIGLLIAGFFALLPLKVVGILDNVQHRFNAAGENAIQKETSNLLSGYLKINAKQCKGSVIKTGCTPSYMTSITSPVSSLYRVWHANKLENTLSDTYGINIQYHQKSGKYFLNTPGLKASEDVTSFIDTKGNLFVEVKQTQVREAVDKALSNETRWKRVKDRFKLGTFLEQKFGIKRCLTEIGCKQRTKIESITDTLKKPRRAAQVYLTERVLMPRSQILGTAMLCLLGQKDCDPAHAKSVPCTTGVDCELNGAAETDGQREIRTTLDKLVARYLTDDAFKLYQEVADNGLGNYFVKQLVISLVKQGGGDAAAQETASKSVDKAIPVVGWANLAAQIINGFHKVGPAVKAMRYAIGATAMVGTYMTYRTYADQIKSGHVDPNEVGSFTDSLGPGYHNTENLNSKGQDPNQVGGTATAEASPIYDSIVNGSDSTNTTSFLNSDKVYAATQQTDTTNSSGTYVCPSLCPEERIDGGNDVLNNISGAFDSGPLGILGTIAKIWTGTVGKGLSFIGDTIGKIVGSIPGFSNGLDYVTSLVGKIAQPVLTWFTNKLIPNPFGTDMSGARTVNMIIGGADVAGNDYAHHGLGGQVISSQLAANIINEQTAQAKYEFSQQSFFSKMFSKTSQFSLINKIAMASPLNKSTLVSNSFGSLISNPISKIMSGVASMFSPHKVEAATAATDPFGITQYGYPDDKIPQDPGSYWIQNCKDNKKTLAWNNASIHSINQNNGQLENNDVDPCLLIQATVGSAGGYYSTEVLTPDDLSGSQSQSSTSTSSGNSTSTKGYKDPLRDVTGLSPNRIDQGVDYSGTGPVYAVGNGVVIDSNPHSQWPDGNWISYQLSDGPAAGKIIYFAEDCAVAVSAGQNVTPNTVICNMYTRTKGPGVETGWAQPGLVERAVAHSEYHEGLATSYGQNFSAFMKSIGSTPGNISLSSSVSSTPLPAGWPTW